MTENIVQITSDFLNALVDANVFKWNVDNVIKKSEKIKKFAIRNSLAGNAFAKISKMTENQDVLTKDERFVFLYWNAVNIATSSLELCKTLLTLFLDPDKIKFKNTTTYGTLIHRICDAVDYDKELRKKLFESLYVNFRNTISHEDYDVTSKGVFLYNDEKTIHLDPDGIKKALNEIKAILNTIKNFINQRTKELDEEADKLDKQAEKNMQKV